MPVLKRHLTVLDADGCFPESSQRESSRAIGSLMLPESSCFMKPPPKKRISRGQSAAAPWPSEPQSPQTTRALRDRISWSEILSQSQSDSQQTQEDVPMKSPAVRLTFSRQSSLESPVKMDNDEAMPAFSPARNTIGGGLVSSSPPPRTPRVGRLRPPSSPPQTEFPARQRFCSGEDDMNDGRFHREFTDVRLIGEGQFSHVYSARHRWDQGLYAVKKTKPIPRGRRQAQLREAIALRALVVDSEGSPHIVRYYTSWFEDGRLFIQTELCEGSLRDYLKQIASRSDPRCTVAEITEILQHCAKGLHAMHTRGYTHLDIKPDNILRTGRNWKIADLGLANAAMGTGCDEVCEGDCRYLAREVLRGDLSDLQRADVFSLGIMTYELSVNPHPLPCSGEEWHALRDGKMDTSKMFELPAKLHELIEQLVHPTVAERPLCIDILQHPCIASPAEDVKALHEKLEQKDREAERNRQMADQYWHELLTLKKRELLGILPQSAEGASGASNGNRAKSRSRSRPKSTSQQPLRTRCTC
eukprot:gnl/MRDRNA2_/MRDRNA2_105314_c0_seq1.p1 gnl/MRDRNA2_/MRDRNA2_105314_c0~~gnl/MRDRNA2_/MRDRNA2_105314_c0_seq1.p1  ORF type:complete len:551 (+),score=77.14 gnl/MRDRNA2_/MRDRNA2_105314_c0_seq1:64-1653(+)